MKKEYKSLSKYYDVLHNKKDYLDETRFFTNLINKNKKSKGNRLLDVACGTGNHIFYFKKNFKTEGVDLSKNLIKIAKEKNPAIRFKVADMRKLESKKKYDIITLLFSSIAYLKNENEIIKILRNFNKILENGGILIIETLYLKDSFKEIKNHVRKYSDNSSSIRRLLDSTIRNNVAKIRAKYLIKEKNKKERKIIDELEILLLTKKWLVKNLQDMGFNVKISKYKKTGTIIFICVKK